ncbi:MAG: hypothetical protein ABI855_20695, partial [Bacteroidota bacterium]
MGASNLGYYNINCAPYVFTGGTLQIGDASTPAGQTMQIFTDDPIANLAVYSTNSPAAQLAASLTVTGNTVINSGSTLNCNSLNLTMGGDITNNGTLTSGSNFTTFNGSSAQQIGGTTTPISFNNLTINNSSGDVTINNNGSVNVNGSLNFSSGKIILGTNNLVIASGNAITGFNTGSYVVTNGTPSSGGYLQINNLTSSRDFPIGESTSAFSPVLNFVNTGAADNFNARVFPGVYMAATSGAAVSNNVVNKTWMIDETTAGGSNVSMNLEWNSSDELAGFNRANCGISQYIAASTSWSIPTSYGLATANPAPYYEMSEAAITAFSPFIIQSGVSPLPVELLSFNAVLNHANATDITWTTVSENNSDYFTVQRSEDFTNFTSIAKVKAKGNSTETNKYFANDFSPSKGWNYYRLLQTDFNGTTDYSRIIPIYTDNENTDIHVNNPVQDNLNLTFNTESPGVTYIFLYDVSGKLVMSKEIKSHEKDQVISMDCRMFVSGLYSLFV